MYASCSKDGEIKLWDSVSNRCFNTFANAHEGSEVCSVQFSRNSKVKKLTVPQYFSNIFLLLPKDLI